MFMPLGGDTGGSVVVEPVVEVGLVMTEPGEVVEGVVGRVVGGR